MFRYQGELRGLYNEQGKREREEMKKEIMEFIFNMCGSVHWTSTDLARAVGMHPHQMRKYEIGQVLPHDVDKFTKMVRDAVIKEQWRIRQEVEALRYDRCENCASIARYLPASV